MYRKKLPINDEEEKLLRTYIESKNYAALSHFIEEKKLNRCDETSKVT